MTYKYILRKIIFSAVVRFNKAVQKFQGIKSVLRNVIGCVQKFPIKMDILSCFILQEDVTSGEVLKDLHNNYFKM